MSRGLGDVYKRQNNSDDDSLSNSSFENDDENNYYTLSSEVTGGNNKDSLLNDNSSTTSSLSKKDSDIQRHKSFLDNDNIDSLKPRRRSRLERQSISNIALTDAALITPDAQQQQILLSSPPQSAISNSGSFLARSRAPSISNNLLRSPPLNNAIMNTNHLAQNSNNNILLNQHANDIPDISLDTGANTSISKSKRNSVANMSNQQQFPPLSTTSSITSDPDNIVINHKRIAPYCFAFDIDGVILKGPTLIPEAKEAISMLNGNNKHNIVVPYVFVTNGGGTDEKLRAEKLSNMLECHVDEMQVIQGHTPMRSLTGKYNNVLIVGGLGDNCRQIGLKYGFKNVYTVVDIIHWNPSVTPYYKLNEEEEARAHKGLDFSKINIDCILVMADSRNWVVDQQIILELLLSDKGVMGTHIDIRHDDDPAVISKKLEKTQPDLYFAHSDFVWATDYNLTRYGMGALQVSLAALYKEHTNGLELRCKRFGKPQRTTFDFTFDFLQDWRKHVVADVANKTRRRAQSISNAGLVTRQASVCEDVSSPRANSNKSSISQLRKNNLILNSKNIDTSNALASDDDDEEDEMDALSPTTKHKFTPVPFTSDDSEEDDEDDDEKEDDIITINKHSIKIPPPTTVYFVGDTPESDIRFANLHHESWFSILVETGVYQHGAKPKYEPKAIKKTVLNAVEWVIEREYQKEVAEWKRLSVDHS